MQRSPHVKRLAMLKPPVHMGRLRGWHNQPPTRPKGPPLAQGSQPHGHTPSAAGRQTTVESTAAYDTGMGGSVADLGLLTCGTVPDTDRYAGQQQHATHIGRRAKKLLMLWIDKKKKIASYPVFLVLFYLEVSIWFISVSSSPSTPQFWTHHYYQPRSLRFTPFFSFFPPFCFYHFVARLTTQHLMVFWHISKPCNH